MSSSERRNKSQAMAADLVRRGFYHGKRQSVGLSNIPSLNVSGSAAYRRALGGKTGAAKPAPAPAPYSPSLTASITAALSHDADHVGRHEAKVHVTERELLHR